MKALIITLILCAPLAAKAKEPFAQIYVDEKSCPSLEELPASNAKGQSSVARDISNQADLHYCSVVFTKGKRSHEIVLYDYDGENALTAAQHQKNLRALKKVNALLKRGRYKSAIEKKIESGSRKKLRYQVKTKERTFRVTLPTRKVSKFCQDAISESGTWDMPPSVARLFISQDQKLAFVKYNYEHLRDGCDSVGETKTLSLKNIVR